MAKPELQAALDNVSMVFNDVRDIANEITREAFAGANSLIMDLDAVNELSVDLIRDYMLKLSICSFALGETKEKSAIKAECAEALRKEKMAYSYSAAVGTNSAKENTATIESSNEIIAEALYSLVANLYKTKIDEIHRVIDTLKSILMSRMQEAKLINMSAAEDPDTYKTKIQLNEEESRRIR